MHWVLHRSICADIGRLQLFEKADVGQMRIGEDIRHAVIFHRWNVMFGQQVQPFGGGAQRADFFDQPV